MIYTLTLNPSIDFYIFTDTLEMNGINKVDKTISYTGGKGINVSTVIHRLGGDSICLGFVGGNYGTLLKKQIEHEGLTSSFTTVNDETRQNVKIRGTVETDLNAKGPVVSTEELDQLLQQLSLLNETDIIVVAGSSPRIMVDAYFEKICDTITKRKAKLIIDTNSKELRKALQYNPYLIKPNKEELEGLIGKELNVAGVIQSSKELLNSYDIHYILVSLGKDGAILITKDDVIQEDAMDIEVLDSVCAGDTLLGAFLYGIQKNFDDKKALKFAIEAASLTVQTSNIASMKKLQRLGAKYGL